MTNTGLLQQAVNDSGKKYQYLAEKLKISRNALHKKINNRSEFKASEIFALCEELNISSPEKKDAIFFAKDGDLKSLERMVC